MDRQKGHRDQHAEERLGCTLQERMKKRTWPVLKHVTAYTTETCFYGLQCPPERKMFITLWHQFTKEQHLMTNELTNQTIQVSTIND